MGKTLAPLPESPPGCLALVLLHLLLLAAGARLLHRAATAAARGVAAYLLHWAVDTVAVRAVRALVTLGPD